MMKPTTSRLVFIDVIRAFAICMMLEGHFIDGLLAPEYRDENNLLFATWLYIRGMTAPVFFTVSGFIFTYLLIKEQNEIYKPQEIRFIKLRTPFKPLLFLGNIYNIIKKNLRLTP